MNNFWHCLRLYIWMAILTGILYPLLITIIALFSMHPQATGSIISRKGKAVGSQLIAQKFTKDKYFWPRPSAVDYNPLPSGGSNLGPISAELKKNVDERAVIISKTHANVARNKIPSELLFASGSGLDPHISPEAALFQVERVAKARKMEASVIKKLIHKMTEKRLLGFLGQNCVNVLSLNIALDELNEQH
jgi:potassium-transporting ATPase KdpC subunit